MAYVDAFVDGTLLPESNNIAEIRFGPLEPAWVQRITQMVTGDIHALPDLNDHTRRLDTDGLIHAFDNHGPGNEKISNQIPISAESVALYIDAINDPEIVIVREVGPRGEPTIRYEKQINGRLFIVEEIFRGQKTLSFLSMWIKKR